MADEKDKKDAPAAAPAAATDKKGDKPADKSEKGEAKPAEAAKPASAGASPWIPVLVVIIILPILSFVVSDFVIIPRVKRALADIVHVQQESAQPAGGGPLPAERKELKGEKKEGDKGADTSVKFENVVANLSGSMKTRFVKVSFTVEGDDADFKSTVESNKAKLIDSCLGILGGLTVSDLDEPGVKNVIRSDLVDAFNQILPKPLIKGLYFSEFVIQ